MQSILEKLQNEYEKSLRKLNRLYNSYKSLSKEKKIKAFFKIKETQHRLVKAEFIYLGKRMEQAGRDLTKAAGDIPDTPGEEEIIINVTNNTPKTQISLKPRFKDADLYKKIVKDSIGLALDEIEATYNEIFPKDEEDDDEEDEEDTVLDPLLPGGKALDR